MKPTSRESAYLYSAAGVCALALTGVASGIMSSRMLGPEGRGELTALIFLPTLVGQMANTGISQAVGYLDNDAGKPQQPVAASAVLLALAAGCLLALLVYPFLPVLLPHLPPRMLPVAASCLSYIPICFILRVVLGASLARGDFRSYNFVQALAGVAQVLLMALLYAAGIANSTTFGFAVVLAIAIAALAKAPFLVRLFSRGEVSLSAARKTLAKAWEFTRPELASVALLRCDVLLLARTVSVDALGLYVVALAVATGQSLMAPALAQVAFHRARSAPDRSAAADSLARQFCFLQILFVAIAGITLSVTPLLIRIAFGAKFIAGTRTACVLVTAMAVWSCSQVAESGLRAMDLASACMGSNLAGLFFLVVLSQFLVRSLGIEGMGWSMFAAQAIALTAKLLMLVRATRCPWSCFWGFSRARIGEFKSAAIEQLVVPFLARNAERGTTVGVA